MNTAKEQFTKAQIANLNARTENTKAATANTQAHTALLLAQAEEISMRNRKEEDGK